IDDCPTVVQPPEAHALDRVRSAVRVDPPARDQVRRRGLALTGPLGEHGLRTELGPRPTPAAAPAASTHAALRLSVRPHEHHVDVPAADEELLPHRRVGHATTGVASRPLEDLPQPALVRVECELPAAP